MLSKYTVTKLRQIQRQISGHPVKFLMSSFVEETITGTKADSMEETTCNTAACIAGWAMINVKMEGKQHLSFDAAHQRVDRCSNPFTTGQRVLKLTEKQAERLFYIHSWPAKFYNQYQHRNEHFGRLPLNVRKKNARVAVARIEHFIKTGGDE